jgi:membrane associated rhomboid family serine protease
MYPRIPLVTQALLIANGLVFVLQWYVIGDFALDSFKLWPLGGGFMPWQLLTYGFMHGGGMHLFFNMFALYMFGAPLEYTWGQKRFLTYFLVCVVGAGLIQLGIGSWNVAHGGDAYPTVGASGGVFGLLLAFAMLFPNQQLIVFPLPFPIKARTFVILYGALELVLGFNGWQSGVAHFAHLGGMLFGWLMIRYWRGQPPFNKRKPPGPRIVR